MGADRVCIRLNPAQLVTQAFDMAVDCAFQPVVGIVPAALQQLAAGEDAAQQLFSRGIASRLDSTGLLIFLILGWLGTWWGSAYFFNNFIGTPEAAQFTLLSGGIMPMANLALGLKVASALFLVFALLSAFKITIQQTVDTPDPEKQQEDAS